MSLGSSTEALEETLPTEVLCAVVLPLRGPYHLDLDTLMSIRLTDDQQKSLDAHEEDPPRVVDPRSNAAYVLLRLEEYETVREVLEEERHRDAIQAAAIRNAVGRMNEMP